MSFDTHIFVRPKCDYPGRRARCGGQIPQRPTAVRDERHAGRPGAIPKHDRRNAHWRKMKEGEK